MKYCEIPIAAAIFALTASAQPLIHFEGLTTGTSVEGLGTVHPDLNIQTPTPGDAGLVIETGVSPFASYGAPNPGSGIKNNCLEDATGARVNEDNTPQLSAKGFANTTAQIADRPQDFDFTFAGGVTLSEFSLRMFDFGDFSPGTGVRAVTVTGFFTAGGSTSTTLNVAAAIDVIKGDACTAAANLTESGYYEFKVQGAGIDRVELRATGDADPKIGYDSISFVREVKIDHKPGSNPNCRRINRGNTSVAIFGSVTFDVTTIDQSTIDFGGASPKKCSLEDALMEGPASVFSVDGLMDLTCRFKVSNVGAAPSPGEDCVQVELTGQLNNGTPISGSDAWCVPGDAACNAGTPLPLP